MVHRLESYIRLVLRSKSFKKCGIEKWDLAAGLLANILVPQLRFFGDKFFHHLNTFSVI